MRAVRQASGDDGDKADWSRRAARHGALYLSAADTSSSKHLLPWRHHAANSKRRRLHPAHRRRQYLITTGILPRMQAEIKKNGEKNNGNGDHRRGAGVTNGLDSACRLVQAKPH